VNNAVPAFAPGKILRSVIDVVLHALHAMTVVSFGLTALASLAFTTVALLCQLGGRTAPARRVDVMPRASVRSEPSPSNLSVCFPIFMGDVILRVLNQELELSGGDTLAAAKSLAHFLTNTVQILVGETS
jgi:hypothetical protein